MTIRKFFFEKLVKKSDFTLGEEVNNFEKKFARLVVANLL